MLSTNPVDIAIPKFDNHHPRVKLIRNNITLSYMFQFERVSLDDILKEITNLNTLSANPTKWSKVLKQFVGKLPMGLAL